jgi:hypothetical protein
MRTFQKNRVSLSKTGWAALFFLLVGVSGFAQNDSSGVYASAEDFTNQKLTLASDCKTEKHRIKLNDFAGKSYIEVIHQGEPHRFEKSEIFGYRQCDGNVFRFVSGKHYRLLNPTERVLLYKSEISPIGKNPGKTTYYFSKDAASAALPLTLRNLKAGFPDNHAFHDALDAQFKTDEGLAAYDSYHKMYKINHLLKSSEK